RRSGSARVGASVPRSSPRTRTSSRPSYREPSGVFFFKQKTAYEIGREHRYDLYDLFLEMPRPLVPRHLRLEVDERVYADGSVSLAPDEHAVAVLLAELRDKGIEAIAMCFVRSFGNPENDQLVMARVGNIT